MAADKAIVITGAADGIGRAAALRLANAGWRVLAMDRSKDRLDQLGRDSGIVPFVGDVTDPAANIAAVAEAERCFGRLDAAVFNAGISDTGGIDAMPVEQWMRIIEVNLFGPYLGIRATVPALRRQGGGSIVVTSSLMGIGGDQNSSAYASSKHGVIGLVRSLARELGCENIRVNALCPGLTDTGMTSRLRNDAPDHHAAIAGQVALGRWAQADEMASTIEFLLSPAASYVSGHALVVDGAASAGTGLMPPQR